MKDHIQYLKYVLRHKYYVLKACKKTGTSLWRGLMHDMSKFKPSEWFPYVHTFYAKDGSKQYVESLEFDLAWNGHQKFNKHHHQFWTLLNDDGTIVPLPMPEKYVREMIADWISASFVITGKDNVLEWVINNRKKMRLHKETIRIIDFVFVELGYLAKEENLIRYFSNE